jgi:2-keto-4-pentenoate hydratase/2-oxohepta-3-ene-1,7-dioic acid hydratase in catechol pathway
VIAADRSFRLGTTERGPVVEHAGARTRLSTLLGDGAPGSLLELTGQGGDVLDAIAAALDDVAVGDADGTPWLAPLVPRKLVCIGANYDAHNAEMLGEIEQDMPYAFLKPPTTTIVADGATVAHPSFAEHLDYEAELAVVMGAGGQIFGYAPLNDLSVRDWVPPTTKLGIDWLLSKGFDGSAPFGPTITPARFVGDVQDLAVRCEVNGEIRQDSSTSDMTFGVEAVVAHVRTVMTLEPGDVIATGTPAGVGAGADPPRFLQPGDVVVVEVDGLGRLTTHIGPRNSRRQG